MPPDSKTIFDEGASIETFKIVKAGQFDEAGITHLLVDVPASYPGGVGTRTLADNLSDIRAQIAATFKGVTLIKALVKEHSLPVVQMYMRAIQETAEQAVRGLLKKIAARNNGAPLYALDHMDDGTPVALTISIDPETGASTFDFTGTGPEVYGASACSLMTMSDKRLTTSYSFRLAGSWNAPAAICNSSVMYSIRCLIGQEIPYAISSLLHAALSACH